MNGASASHLPLPQLASLAAAALLLVLAGCGGDFAGEIRQLEEKAAQLAREQAMTRVQPETVAQEMGYSWPLASPTKTTEQLRQQVNAEVTSRVEEQFPRTLIEDLRRETEAKYKLVERDAVVKFVINQGEGVRPMVEGPYRGTDNQGRFLIGEMPVARIEFSREDLARLDPNVHQQVVETEFRQRLFMANENRRLLGEKLFAELYPEALRADGYTQVNDKWLPIDALVKTEIADRLGREARRLTPETQAKVFTEAGFQLKDGEWQPSLRKRILGR